MIEPFTPTTEQMRRAVEDSETAYHSGLFDRWLAAHDAEICSAAREAADSGLGVWARLSIEQDAGIDVLAEAEPERTYRVRSKVAPYRVHRSTTKAGSR